MSVKPNPPINTDDPNNPSPNPKPRPTPAVMAQVAANYGPTLTVPAALDGAAVMLALAMSESSLGRNVGPRFEPSYYRGGSVWQASELQRNLVDKWERKAACSYGPWQMMLINFSPNINPDDLDDIDLCAREFVKFFNRFVGRIRKPNTLEEIGHVWNGGHVFKAPLPPTIAAYAKRLRENYTNAINTA